MKKTFTYLIVITALMIISASAMAQGGLTPIVGSSHDYTVTPDDAGNTLLWTLSGGGTLSNEGTAEATVVWNTVGTYTLQFSEEDVTTGCITTKQVSVVVADNTFDVSTSDPLATCNALDGTINPSGDATTNVTFTVTSTTGRTDWSPDWEISFTLTLSGSSSIGALTPSEGDLSESSGTYTLTNITSTNGDGSVTITIPVTEDAFTLQTTDLNITSATALDHNLSDIDSDDWVATQVINALPATTDITTD